MTTSEEDTEIREQTKIVAKALNKFLEKSMPVFKENHSIFQYMINTLVAAQIQTGMGNAQDIIGELIGHMVQTKLIEINEIEEEDFMAMHNMETPPKGEMN